MGIAAAYLLLAGSRTRKVLLDVPPRGSELPARPLQLPDNTHKSVKAATAAGQSAYYEPNTSAGHVHTKIDALVGELESTDLFIPKEDVHGTSSFDVTPLHGDDVNATAELIPSELYGDLESLATEVDALPTYTNEDIAGLINMHNTGDALDQATAVSKLDAYGANIDDFVSVDPVTYSEDLTTAADHYYELPSGAQVPESVIDHKMAYLEHKKAMHKPEKNSAAPPTKVPPTSGSLSGEAPPKGPEVSHQEDADPH